MTKEEFAKLEREAEAELEENNNQEILDEIFNEGVSIFNEIFDFCQENDLEPDPVIQLICKHLQAERRKQLKKQGYISKI